MLDFPCIIIKCYMSSNGNEGGSSTNPLRHFHIPKPVPFKITVIPLRTTTKYDRDGHWNEKQRLKYSIFLSYFHELFNDPSSRKIVKIYEMMSDMIITRNPNQCRSHHQKMEKYRTTIPDIISSVAERYEPRVYEQQSLKYLVLIKNILENQQKYIRTNSSQEEVKYFYTTFVSKKEGTRKDRKEGKEVQGKVMEKEDEGDVGEKDKEDKIKTTDSYLNVQLYQEEDAVIQHIPVMNPLDPKLEEDEHQQEEVPSSQQIREIPILAESSYIPAQTQVRLSVQGRMYYQQQIKLLQMKREWHCHNSQQLSTQLRAQQQSMRHCDMTIQLYQSALGSNST